MTECCPQQLTFPSLIGKPVVAEFTGEQQSSDSGLLLLGEVERELRLIDRLVRCLHDRRAPEKVVHELSELVSQRVFQIAAGYEDCNDADKLRSDPILKLCCGRRPSEQDLGSQPTLSRLENSVSLQQVRSIFDELMRLFVSQQRRAPGHVIIDLDSTDDKLHGHQQLRLFNGYYDSYCYLPLIITLEVDDGQIWPLFAWLRPAHHGDRCEASTWLLRVIRRLRAAWPKTRLIVRADSGFAGPDLYRLCEEEAVGYVIGLARNARLKGQTEALLAEAQERYASGERPVQLYSEFHYQADSWRRIRRVVGKAEVTAKGHNQRFVVHNLRGLSAEEVYKLYGRRGEVENRIKELKLGLKMDRTSCHRFAANAFRVVLHLAAYLLYVVVRERLAGTELARAQVHTLRERLVKVGAWVRESVRRVLIRCPQAYPWPHLWSIIVCSPG